MITGVSTMALSFAFAVFVPTTNADILGDNNDLGDLFILDQLFSGGVLSDVSVGGAQRTVTVQGGETLSGIAARELGNASLYPLIVEANNISNPNLIRTGQVLVIPTQEQQQQQNGGTTGGSNLGDLFVLDRLFGGDGGGSILGGSGDGNDLGDLIILDQLFGNGGLNGGNGLLGGTNGGSLGDLIILDELFGNGGGDVLGGGSSDLGDLIILDQLFGNGGNLFGGSGSGTGSNLGDLFILDKLF